MLVQSLIPMSSSANNIAYSVRLVWEYKEERSDEGYWHWATLNDVEELVRKLNQARVDMDDLLYDYELNPFAGQMELLNNVAQAHDGMHSIIKSVQIVRNERL